MKVYIAGKVTGLPMASVKEKFSIAETELRAKGHTTINPIRVIETLYNDPENIAWEQAMKTCLIDMMSCHAVCILPCWAKSRGATLERFIAGCLKIPVYEGPGTVPFVHEVATKLQVSDGQMA